MARSPVPGHSPSVPRQPGFTRRAALVAALGAGCALALAACGAGATATTTASASATPATSVVRTTSSAIATSASSAAASTAATATTASLAASSASAQPGAATGTLQVLTGADANQLKVFQQVVDAFHQAGHKPTVVLSNPSSVYTKFDAMLAGGTGPDLFAGFQTKQLPHYAGVGAALNMDPYMARSTIIKPADFFAYTWSKDVINGHLNAMPAHNAPLGIFYNEDLFKEAGVAPPPSKWGSKGWDAAAFLDTAHKLTKKNSGGAQQWFSSWSTWWLYALPWVWANGGHMFDATISKVLVDAPEVVSSFQWLADLTWKEHVQPTPEEAKANSPSFIKGTLAIQGVTADGAPGYLQQITSFKWNVGVMPVGTYGVWTRDPSISTMAWSGTKQPDMTWELAEFMGSDPGQLIIGLGGLGVPARISAAKSDKFLHQSNGVDWQVFVDGIDHEGIQPITDNFPQIDSTITKQTAPLWANQATAQTVMTTLKPLLEELLKSAKFRRDRGTLWQQHGWATPTT